MKKYLSFLLVLLLLLCGCQGSDSETTVPTTLPQETQAEVSILDGATPWDQEGQLLEIHLSIPDGMQYSAAMELDGDLLLWNIDSHLPDIHIMELCVVDLQTGAVTGARDVQMQNYCQPQVLGDSIFLCDNYTGEIIRMNQSLETVTSWTTDPNDGSWYMGANDTLYVHIWDQEGYALDLNTGEKRALLEDGNLVSSFRVNGDYAVVEYYRGDNGAEDCLALNLRTGETFRMPENMRFDSAYFRDGYWLCETYNDGSLYYFGSSEEDVVSAFVGMDTLKILDDGKILASVEEACDISLHDATGASLARATLSAMSYNLFADVVIPSPNGDGYFLLVSDYGTSYRLLYWDLSKSSAGTAISFEPVPKPSEAEQQLLARAEEMEQKYGISIYLGDQVKTSYYDFQVSPVTDWMDISTALDVLDNALSVYPEGFFRQLRYGSIRGLQIHLVGEIESINPEYVHNYVAFVQYEYDFNVMAANIYQMTDQNYFHEISHVIDSYLEYDAANREDALFSEETWSDLNPGWFAGYTYTYSQEHPLEDNSSFLDSYATIKPTEDRARIMEYAMSSWGEYYFDEGSVLMNKLRYYSRCIRDAFDTTGWPEVLPWEQFL